MPHCEVCPIIKEVLCYVWAEFDSQNHTHTALMLNNIVYCKGWNAELEDRLSLSGKHWRQKKGEQRRDASGSVLRRDEVSRTQTSGWFGRMMCVAWLEIWDEKTRIKYRKWSQACGKLTWEIRRLSPATLLIQTQHTQKWHYLRETEKSQVNHSLILITQTDSAHVDRSWVERVWCLTDSWTGVEASECKRMIYERSWGHLG